MQGDTDGAANPDPSCIIVFLFFIFGSVIKTRMQSLEARSQYRNSLHCAYRIFTEEGVLRFWTGTTPRLARLVVRPPPFFFSTSLLVANWLQLR